MVTRRAGRPRRPPGVDPLDWVMLWAVRTEAGCLVLPGIRNGPRDYPMINIDGKTVRLTRYVYARMHGQLDEDIQVLHRCDWPPCFDPEHLFSGTVLDNMQDRSAKGREPHVSGAEHPRAQLTENQVLLARARYAEGGILQIDLAAEFGVSQSVMNRVLLGKTYADSVRAGAA